MTYHLHDIFFAFLREYLDPRWNMGYFPLERVSDVNFDPSSYETES